MQVIRETQFFKFCETSKMSSNRPTKGMDGKVFMLDAVIYQKKTPCSRQLSKNRLKISSSSSLNVKVKYQYWKYSMPPGVAGQELATPCRKYSNHCLQVPLKAKNEHGQMHINQQA